MIQTSQALWGGEANTGCFLEAFAEIVRTQERRVAIRDGLEEITYGHLAAWVEQIAGLLTEYSVTSGEPVAVTGPRSGAVVAAALAIAVVGAAYVPLDAEYPVRRQRHMATDSGARLLLFAGDTPSLGADLTSAPIPAAPAIPARGTAVLTHRACEPDAPVYIIYTSGSTGLPKGVALPHRCVDNMAAWQLAHSVRTDLLTAQFAPMNFDVWFQEVLGTLCAGGTLSIMPESLRKDPFAFLDWLASERIERVFLPYVALQMLAVAAEAEDSLDRLCLAEVNTAGEQLVCTPTIREFFGRVPGCRLNNHYGQSESAMVAVHTITGPSTDWPALPPVGRPLPECEVLIAPTEPGDPSVGELLVAGAPMSTGYLHQPALTLERYVDVTLTPRGHTRAFRTGDLVRVVDGVIHFISRVDHEVKIRGVRVNPLEVDACLLDFPGVVEAVTVPVETVPGSRQLRAAVTMDRDEQPGDVGKIIEALASHLPDQAIPVSVTVLPRLPRTPSGKIDRGSIGDMLMATARGFPAGSARTQPISSPNRRGQVMSSDPCLLILDYPGRRTAAHLDKLGLEDLGFQCRYLLTRPMPDEVTSERYARKLADEHQATDGNVRAVISYCAAAPLAAELAERVSGDCPAPVIMLDPFDCDQYHLADQYAAVVWQIEGGGLAEGSLPLLDVAAGISRPRVLADQITRDLSARAKRSLAGSGDEVDADEMAAHVVSMYVDWLKFVLAACHRRREVRMGAALHVVSRQGLPCPDWLGAGKVQTAKIDCEHDELACCPETRSAIKEFLERWA